MKQLLSMLYRGKPGIRRFLSGLILIGHASLLFGQGSAFTYQGQLSDQGEPATGFYNFSFGLYPTNSGGVPAAILLTNSSVLVSNGLFTTVLDFGPVFDGTAYWLEIGVQPADSTNGFSTLSPRQALNSNPYAAYAATAGAVNGVLATTNLPASVALLNSSPNFSGIVIAPGFIGDGGGLTNLNAGSLVGMVGVGQLPAGVVTNGAAGVNLAGAFAGDGSGLSNLNVVAQSTNVALLNGNQVFSGTNVFNGVVRATNAANELVGALSGRVVGDVAGNADTATSAGSAGNFSGLLVGDVMGVQGATVVVGVGGQSAANVANGAELANAATSANTPGTIVQRDGAGGFAAGSITGTNFIGDGGGLTNLNAGSLVGMVGAGQLPAGVVTNGAAGVTLGGAFAGDGSGLSNLNVVVQSTNVALVFDTNLMSSLAADGQVLTYHSATGRYYPSNTPVGNVPAGLITNGVAGAWTNASGMWNTNGTYSAFNSLGSSENSFYAGAGNPSVSGSDNEGFGAETLTHLSSGSGNTAFGRGALYLNTTGSGNTAIGSQTLFYNIDGIDNIAIGGMALYANTNGSDNTAVGNLALASNLDGRFNTGLGLSALPLNTHGQWNTALGAHTMLAMTIGSYNVGIGVDSLFNETNSNNTAIGVYSLAAATGAGNTSLGFESGWTLITGDHNLFLGDNGPGYVGPTNGSGNIFIGSNIGTLDGPNSNNRLDIGGLIFGTGLSLVGQQSSGWVGIGQSNPQATLDVAGNIMARSGFIGDGSGLTNLPANQLTGTLPAASLPGITTNVSAAGITFYITNGLIMRVSSP